MSRSLPRRQGNGETGWVCVHRRILRHPVLTTPARRYAWIWLILNAAWKDTSHTVHGVPLDVPRGSLFASLGQLQTDWGWSSVKPVRTFIRDLLAAEMINYETSSGARKGHGKGTTRARITICNYEEFQDMGQASGTERARKGHTKGTREQINKDTPLANANGAEPVFDPVEETKKVLWTEGKSLLCEGYGKSKDQAGRLIGKWRSQSDDLTLLGIIRDCRDERPIDPVGWVVARITPDQSERVDVHEIGERILKKWGVGA